MEVPCFLQLGTNKGDKYQNLEKAIVFIETHIGHVEKRSAVYESEPWGYNDEETYFNQVIKVVTHLSAENLLNKCLEIETQLGRIRTRSSYEARTMDIDILFYGKAIIKMDKLEIPHPRIQERKFVLLPLSEIESEFVHPELNSTIHKILEECEDTCWVKKILPRKNQRRI